MYTGNLEGKAHWCALATWGTTNLTELGSTRGFAAALYHQAKLPEQTRESGSCTLERLCISLWTFQIRPPNCLRFTYRCETTQISVEEICHRTQDCAQLQKPKEFWSHGGFTLPKHLALNEVVVQSANVFWTTQVWQNKRKWQLLVLNWQIFPVSGRTNKIQGISLPVNL